jgi:vacuolar-type H+-ATPase subunit E/Vma4
MATRDSVEKTVKKVVDDTLAELTQDVTKAFEQSGEILSVYERDTFVEFNKILKVGEIQCETLRRQIVGGAEIEVRNKSLQMVEDAVNNVFSKALQRLSNSHSRSSEVVLKRLLLESIEALSGGKIVITGRKEDLGTLRKVAKEVEREKNMLIEVDQKPITCLGGLQARSADGSVLYDNTFEARLERIKSTLRKEVAVLFNPGRSS